MDLHTEPHVIEYKDGVVATATPCPIDPTDDTLPKLIEALGGKEAFDALPVLDIGEETGRTGYLDFLKPEDVTAPIMRGVDSADRPFVTLRMQREFRGEMRTWVECLFRRYRTGGVWVTGGGRRILAIGMVKDEDLAWVSRLVRGETPGERRYGYDDETKKDTVTEHRPVHLV